jgi:hypothetical protein
MPVILAGNTSGSTTIQATDAVTATITLPSATDTLVGKITPSFTTTIGVGNATPSASGAGITFPATQSASSDANTLDDYEEGTWTPNQGSGLTVVGAFSSSGIYTKVGRVVTIHAQFTGATSILVAAANLNLCTNLPFPLANIASYYPNGMGMNNSSNAVYGAFGNLNSSTATSLVAFASSTGLSINLTYFTTT